MPSWKPLLAGLCLFLSAACQAGAAQTLRIGLADDPDMLDPSMARTFTGRVVFAALCDKLLDISPELDIVPQLATEWQWTDGNKGIVMKLRRGVRFHDGEAFAAAAVKFSIERHLNLPGSTRKAEISTVTGVEIIDDYTVKLVLHHALRNALIPAITLAALDFGALLSGAVLTEQMFVDAVFNRDYAVVQGVVLCIALAYIVRNLLADIAYVLVNPRLRG
jgi:ABC-type transport system substrate-binding protein